MDDKPGKGNSRGATTKGYAKGGVSKEVYKGRGNSDRKRKARMNALLKRLGG